MASIPHFFSDYHFSPDEFSEITSIISQDQNYSRFSSSFSSTNMSTTGGEYASSSPGGALLGDHHDYNFPIICDHNNNGGAFENFPGEFDTMSPVLAKYSLPERFGISDMVVPNFMDYKQGSAGGITKIQNFGGGFQPLDMCEYGEDCCGFMPNLTPLCPAVGKNWGLEYNRMAATENTNMNKVGRYTVEERKDRILRYLKKRNQRNFNKTIKYACRKTLADRRVRVRGRFARNSSELLEEETEIKKNDYISHDYQENDSYCNDTIQIKMDEDDEWLREIDMYVPYVAG